MAVVNLDYIVNSCISDLQIHNTNEYDRLLQFAVRGFRKLNLMVLPSIKVAYLTLNENNTIDLPNDFVSYTKIGVVIGGNIWNLTLNKNMALPRHLDECGNVLAAENTMSFLNQTSQGLAVSTDISTFGGIYYVPHWRNGQYVGEQYGLGGGINREGYYREDKEKNQIVFTNIVQGEIVLEYKSNGITVEGGAAVPQEAIEALIAYVDWARINNDDKKSLGEKQMKWQHFVTEYDLLMRYNSIFTGQEYLDLCWRTSKSAPKR